MNFNLKKIKSKLNPKKVKEGNNNKYKYINRENQ